MTFRFKQAFLILVITFSKQKATRMSPSWIDKIRRYLKRFDYLPNRIESVKNLSIGT